MSKLAKRYIITHTRLMNGRDYNSPPLTLDEAIQYFSYTLECGALYEHEKGNKKINLAPKTIHSLLYNLNNASANSSQCGYGDAYTAIEVNMV